MAYRVLAEAAVNRAAVDPGAALKPAGAQAAHLVPDHSAVTVCGRDAEPMFAIRCDWRELQSFYRCTRCDAKAS